MAEGKQKTYTLTNSGKGVRVVHDINKTPVSIDPGASRPGVKLDPEYAKMLEGRKGDDITCAEDVEVAAKAPAPSAETDPTPAQKATELLARADDLSVEDLRAQAQPVLSDKWPGGTPKKQAIVDLLKAQAGAV